MPRRPGDTHLALIQRRDQVKQLLLRQAKLNEMAQVLNVSVDTIRRDVEAVFEEWRKDVTIRERWSHAKSFDYLEEYDRMLMKLFHKKPRDIPFGKHLIPEDRSFIQVQIMKVLLANLRVKNIMAGIGTHKVFEQLRYLQSERARGFETTRINAEDFLKQDVEALRKDLPRQKREGLIRDHPVAKT